MKAAKEVAKNRTIRVWFTIGKKKRVKKKNRSLPKTSGGFPRAVDNLMRESTLVPNEEIDPTRQRIRGANGSCYVRCRMQRAKGAEEPRKSF